MKAQTRFIRHLGNLGCALAFAAGTFALPACSGVGGSAATGGGGGGTGTTGNSVSVAVNSGPALTAKNSLLASVTICVPGSSNCQTITNVLVDTGSSGFRVLATQLTIPLLPAIDTNGNPLAECLPLSGGSAHLWGSVSTADVKLAGEVASAVPIQIILAPGAAGFPAVPNSCLGVDDGNVSNLGANGILGVGTLKQDCGAACAAAPPANVYYDAGAACVPTSCALISVPLVNQVQNPVALFAKDNNGVVITLPSVGSSGAATASGTLAFGIGTQTNNGLGSAKVYTTDALGFITTSFNNISYPQSFLESGTPVIAFLVSATSGLPACTVNIAFYCPASSTNFTVTNTGNNGTSAPVTFSIFSADTLFSGNPTFTAFSNIGAPFSSGFDFGLPFFYGKSVFTAISGQTTPGGTGPFYAY